MKIGFRFKKVDGRKFLLEGRDVTVARSRFLREMKRRKESGQKFVYLDETWVNQNYTVQKCWTDLSSQQATGVKPPTGKGSRLIILHAGTEDGFVNAELVFQARNDGDYHEQMNAEVFEKWFRNQLLPNIPPNCAIVMDNASYHSMQQEKYPTSSWKKENIKHWLIENGEQPSDDLLKIELYELAKRRINNMGKKYKIDEIAAEAGHKIVRIPPYHCQYNPIELIWAQVKSYIAKKNTFKLADLKILVQEAVNNVTAENWKNAAEHVGKIQEEDARQDAAVDKLVDSFVINIADSSDDEFSE
ncbi:uncharacterized protein [Macrobrachium rosenbergii]|uniref:uncharacterized protein n=1 Tax=Macrobrachium rosenbergii TaxID=79674 RepID=UPI0034D60696